MMNFAKGWKGRDLQIAVAGAEMEMPLQEATALDAMRWIWQVQVAVIWQVQVAVIWQVQVAVMYGGVAMIWQVIWRMIFAKYLSVMACDMASDIGSVLAKYLST